MSDKALVVSNPLAPATFAEAQKFAEMIAKSEFVPQSYKGKPGDIMIAMQMGAEVGLPPLAALQNIAVIRGKPTIWGDAIPAIAMRHPDFEAIDETFDEAHMTATCKVKRKGMTWQIRTFSKADAEAAGLWGKDTWKSYPKRMLQMRARGFAMRDVFPDALRGLITREEAEDYPALKVVNAEPEQAEPTPPSPGATGSSPRQQQAPSGERTAASPTGNPESLSRGQGQAATATPSPETPAPTSKPAMPDDPEQGERGITMEQWIDITEGLRDSTDNADLKARYLKAVKDHENTWTAAQFEVINGYKDQLKAFHGGK